MHFSYEFEMQTRAFQSSAIASFLRYTSELAPLSLTIIAQEKLEIQAI
ncbi:MAG: hypothetical protein ACI4LR_03010 [Treponema sp.]